MRKDLKYKLVKGRAKLMFPSPSKATSYYRIQALKDIPLHGVKAGDLGGYVSYKDMLSQEGSCWIGGDAVVYNNVRVNDDAYIGDNAHIMGAYKAMVTIGGRSKVIEYAQVIASYAKDIAIIEDAVISGHTRIHDAKEISGTTIIMGHSRVLEGARVTGTSTLTDNATVRKDAFINNTVVSGNAEIGEAQRILNKTLSGDGVFVNETKIIHQIKVDDNAIDLPVKKDYSALINAFMGDNEDNTRIPVVPAVSSKHENIIAYYREVKDKINAYATDIAKIIQYPLMTDQTEPHTMAMTMAMNKTERLFRTEQFDELDSMVEILEEKFLAAESNALKVASTMLNVEEVKKTATARKMLNMAANKGSTEHEKKTAFTQAFKELEGVLTVPEVAKDTFRVKVGLKELEASI